jgi:hypothetical protein
LNLSLLEVIFDEENSALIDKILIQRIFKAEKQNLQINNRIVRFIFDLEKKEQDYKFISENGSHINLPFFSVLALLYTIVKKK